MVILLMRKHRIQNVAPSPLIHSFTIYMVPCQSGRRIVMSSSILLTEKLTSLDTSLQYNMYTLNSQTLQAPLGLLRCICNVQFLRNSSSDAFSYFIEAHCKTLSCSHSVSLAAACPKIRT